MDLTVLIILLALMTAAAVLSMMLRNLLKAAIALALTSAILTVVMFMLKAPLAAVFELSVCAGLITVIFVSAISMTKPHTKEETAAKSKERLKRFIYLPFLLILITAALVWFIQPYVDLSRTVKAGSSILKFQDVLWNNRQLEVLGQIIMIIAGVFGIVVLFKEREAK